MQIRAGNRQDEATVRTIVFQSLEEFGILSELDGRDSDLRNIEKNYFWYDGLCLAAERNGELIGFLAGRRREGQEEILDLKRLAVVPSARKQGVATALMKTAKRFAANLEYKSIELSCPGLSKELSEIDPMFLQKLGFTKADSGSWHQKV